MSEQIDVIEDPLYTKAKMTQSTNHKQETIEIHIPLRNNEVEILNFKEKDIIVAKSSYQIIRCSDGTLGLKRIVEIL